MSQLKICRFSAYLLILCDVSIFFSVLTEVQCLNETQKYLRKIVHEIGLELRSTAACKGVRRTREGPFTLQDALTRHHWTASDVMEAIRQYHISKKGKKYPHTQIKDPTLQEENTTTASQQNDTCNEAAALGRTI